MSLIIKIARWVLAIAAAAAVPLVLTYSASNFTELLGNLPARVLNFMVISCAFIAYALAPLLATVVAPSPKKTAAALAVAIHFANIVYSTYQYLKQFGINFFFEADWYLLFFCRIYIGYKCRILP